MSRELTPQQLRELNSHNARISEIGSLRNRVELEGLGTSEELEADAQMCLTLRQKSEGSLRMPETAEEIQDFRQAVVQFTRRTVSMAQLEKLYNELVYSPAERTFIELTDSVYNKAILKVLDDVIDILPYYEQAIEDGKRRAIQDVLSLLEADIPLLMYRRDVLMKITRPYGVGGVFFELPTRIEGIDVNYFYTDNNLAPEVRLVIEPVCLTKR